MVVLINNYYLIKLFNNLLNCIKFKVQFFFSLLLFLYLFVMLLLLDKDLLYCWIYVINLKFL